MNIVAKLPTDRIGEGQIFVDGALMGRCRGKADNAAAAAHGNPHRSPVRPYGDHPAGRSKVFEVRWTQPGEAHSYGPAKLCLQAIDGEALMRQDAAGPGGDEIEAHGGDYQPDGVSLRATYGCLRMPNDVCKVIATQAQSALLAGAEVSYECIVLG